MARLRVSLDSRRTRLRISNTGLCGVELQLPDALAGQNERSSQFIVRAQEFAYLGCHRCLNETGSAGWGAKFSGR